MPWDEIAQNIDWINVVSKGLRIALIIVVGFILTRMLRRAVTKVEQKVSEDTSPIRALQRTQTLTKVLSSAGIVVIWVLGAFSILQTIGWNLAPLLAGVGIIGLAVGFGAQNLVRDVVTGFFILLEDQYGVGDIVSINQGEANGVVETLTLRVTGLRDLDGTVHYIANGAISVIANKSKDWSRAVVDVGVGYGEDPARVRNVLESVAQEAKEDEDLGGKLYSVPDVLGVEMLGEYEVVWRVLAETKPARQFEAGRSIRERIKVAFDKEGIEIPFPHRVMISGNGRAAEKTPAG